MCARRGGATAARSGSAGSRPRGRSRPDRGASVGDSSMPWAVSSACGRPRRSPPSALPFQALGLTFAMTADGGLKLGGDLGPEHPRDAVLVDGRRAIALAPRDPGDVRGLVRALFPIAGDDPTPLVPGDRDSASVQRYL